MMRREVNDFPANVNLSVIYEGIFTQTGEERNECRRETADATGAQASLPATPWLPPACNDYDSIAAALTSAEAAMLQARMPAVQSRPPFAPLTSADKMHDLDPVRIVDNRVTPIFFSNNLAVQLDRDPLRRQ
jgi:hypothetical protein